MVIIMISLIRMMIRMQMVAAESTMMIMKVMCVCYDDDDDSAQKHGSEKSTRVQNSHLCSLCMHERKNDLHICTGREDQREKENPH